MIFWRKIYLSIVIFLSIFVLFLFITTDRLIATEETQLDWASRRFLFFTKRDICPPVLNFIHPTAHRLAVIIPFRERFTELRNLIPHLAEFLNNQSIPHTFYIINQVDTFRFNRAALLNVGVRESLTAETNGVLLKVHTTEGEDSRVTQQHCLFPPTDYLVLHDVDLLPLDPALSYSWPSAMGPVHLIPAAIHPRYYWVKNYFGGIILIRREHFNRVNGFSNSFWGWGWEDDEFRLRIVRSGLSITTPKNVTSGFNAFRVIHNDAVHHRDMRTYSHPDVKKLLYEQRGGLDTTNYTVVARSLLHVDGVPALLIDVALLCNMNLFICGLQPSRSLSNFVSVNP